MGDRSKLPKWAQREIEMLETRLREANAKLAVGPEGSDTFADPNASFMGGSPRPLGKGTTIEFSVDRNRKFNVRLDGEELRISGLRPLMLIPGASNAFTVRSLD